MMKSSSNADNWLMLDVMRGWNLAVTQDARLYANTSAAETKQDWGNPTATGFYAEGLGASRTMIYIAIRRGPMKVPTDGTTVYNADAEANATAPWFTSGFPVDFAFKKVKTSVTDWEVVNRLSGAYYMSSNATSPEYDSANITFDFMNGWNSTTGANSALWSAMFRRAPGFLDVVCYRPPSSSVNTYSHNLAAVPELMIIKTRDSARRWVVYTQTTGNTQALHLNTTDAVNSTGNNYFNSTSPTASVFTLDNGFADVCNGGGLGVAYLFATCAGVSKVGSYTGNGSSQTINCGFTGGARFVLIKKTSGTGDWMVSDSARGIVSGNDPYLELNNTNAEVTGEDWLDTDSTGFVVNEVSGSNANTSSATYIFLAIA
jgi:hypothetical protein